jgi:chemotaxis signal transduction protein
MKRAAIDWGAVRERLRASERELEQVLTPSPQRIEEAYKQRAAQLASLELKCEPAAPGVPVVVFLLGQESYAIEMRELAEVVPFTRCVPVPDGSRQFLGVIHLRGELRAVLDLQNLVGAGGGLQSETGFVLLLRRPGKEIGLKVDQIEELRQIRPEDLLSGPRGEFGKRLASGALVLLSVDAVIEAVFSTKESRIA